MYFLKTKNSVCCITVGNTHIILALKLHTVTTMTI